LRYCIDPKVCIIYWVMIAPAAPALRATLRQCGEILTGGNTCPNHCQSYRIVAHQLAGIDRCASQPPTQAPTQPQATQPAVKETVVVKETVMVKETVIVQPTVAPSATSTATSMARPSAAPVQAVATKTPALGGKLISLSTISSTRHQAHVKATARFN